VIWKFHSRASTAVRVRYADTRFLLAFSSASEYVRCVLRSAMEMNRRSMMEMHLIVAPIASAPTAHSTLHHDIAKEQESLWLVKVLCFGSRLVNVEA
jgi:hypothetical protein